MSPSRSQIEMPAHSTRRSIAIASMDAMPSTFSCSDSAAPSSSSASEMSAASCCSAIRRTFSQAMAACAAITSSRRRSSSSNRARPSLLSTITPTDPCSDTIGATSIDSSIGSVPGISTLKGTADASSIRNGFLVSNTRPVMPSPTATTRSSTSSPA